MYSYTTRHTTELTGRRPFGMDSLNPCETNAVAIPESPEKNGAVAP